jgi:hypothetical protein
MQDKPWLEDLDHGVPRLQKRIVLVCEQQSKRLTKQANVFATHRQVYTMCKMLAAIHGS